MGEPDMGEDRKRAARKPAARFHWGVQFSPHIIVFLLTLLVAIPPLRGTIVSAVHVWWDKSYAKVDYIMDEARPNDGHPYIIGHVEGSTGQSNVLGAMQGTTVVVKTLPQEAFETGKRLPIWHSPDAPNFLVFGTEVNDVPVAALPQRPGVPALIGYSTWLLVTLLVGFGVMVWIGNRWSRIYGNLPMRFRPGSKLRRT